MAYIDMTKVEFDSKNPNSGAVYHEKVTVPNGATSDVYILPYFRIYDISINLTGAGTGSIEFSNSSPDNVRAGNGTWAAWTPGLKVNLATTAFRVISSSGEVIAEVTVKTDKG